MGKLIIILIAFNYLSFLQLIAQPDSACIKLNKCIESAMANNPGIKETVNDFELAKIGIKSAQSALYPGVSADVSGGFSDEYRVGTDYKVGSARLAVDQVLLQWGKVTSSIEQARCLYDASKASLQAREKDLILSVKKVYFSCLQAKQLYRIALENVSRANLFLDYAKNRYQIGTGRKSDVLKAESDLTETEFERDEYLNSLKRAQNELTMLTGIVPEKLSNLDNYWLSFQLPLFNNEADSLITLALKQYPEMIALKELNLAQMAMIKRTRADMFPRLGINAGYDWTYNPIMQQPEGWFSVLTLRWTFFNGNERRYKLQSEQIRKSRYEYQAGEIEIFLVKEVNNCLISIKEAEKQIELTRSLMKTTSENLDIAKAQYNQGTGSMLELTDARISDLTARQKNIQAMTSLLIAVAELERITGSNYI